MTQRSKNSRDNVQWKQYTTLLLIREHWKPGKHQETWPLRSTISILKLVAVIKCPSFIPQQSEALKVKQQPGRIGTELVLSNYT